MEDEKKELPKEDKNRDKILDEIEDANKNASESYAWRLFFGCCG